MQTKVSWIISGAVGIIALGGTAAFATVTAPVEQSSSTAASSPAPTATKDATSSGRVLADPASTVAAAPVAAEPAVSAPVVSEPAAEPASEPASEPAAEPVVAATTEPSTDPTVDPTKDCGGKRLHLGDPGAARTGWTDRARHAQPVADPAPTTVTADRSGHGDRHGNDGHRGGRHARH